MSNSKPEPWKSEPTLPAPKRMGNPNWYKGCPGQNTSKNKGGRPKGSLDKYTILSRQLLTDRGPELVQKVIDMAMAGDKTCLKMCMDRIIPTSKAVTLTAGDSGKGDVIINVSGLDAKVVSHGDEAEYEEGVIISNDDIDTTMTKLNEKTDGKS